MSIEALHYVFEESEARGYDRLVLIAYADSADKGTGFGFNKVETLAHQARVSKSALIDVTRRLEEAGELVVLRPEKRGRGHHNHYVVVMGRDPYALADERGWPRPPLSPTAAAKLVTEPAAAATEPHEDEDTEPPDEATEPVDKSPPNQEKRSPPATVSPPEKVAKRSPKGRPRGDHPQPHPQRTNAARSARGAPPRDPCPEVEQLGAAVRRAGVPDVEWRMSPQQQALVVAAVRLHGVERLVVHAVDQVDQLGPPDRASAWIRGWTQLQPQPQGHLVLELDQPPPAPCGGCDGHLGGPRFIEDADGRAQRCPRCHPMVVAP